MADVKVDKRQSSEQQRDESPTTREAERGLRRRGRDPFGFSLIPSDFFSSDPFSLMRRMHEDIDRNFGRWFGGEGMTSGTWNPAIEVTERNGQLKVCAELPGLKPEDVKVEVTGDSLVIQGERKYENEDNQGGVYRSERRYGQFYREIPLPEGVSVEQAKAQFRAGVLEVTMPAPQQKPSRRSIAIEGTSAGGSDQKQVTGKQT